MNTPNPPGTPGQPQPFQLPPEVLHPDGPEIFADSFYFHGDPTMLRLLFGMGLPSGGARYYNALRVPAPMINDMNSVLTNMRDQLGLAPPTQPPANDPTVPGPAPKAP